MTDAVRADGVTLVCLLGGGTVFWSSLFRDDAAKHTGRLLRE